MFSTFMWALAAPTSRIERTLIPETDNTYDLGSTLKYWANLYANQICLAGDCKTAWPVGGGGGSGGTWSTTTSQVSGRLINYSNNTNDVIAVGSTATTTAEFWYDPTALVGFLSGKFGIGTTTPGTALGVMGKAVIADDVTSSRYVATSTATSTFVGGIQANIFNATSATASSTFANGINLTAGCFAKNGVCLSSGSGSSASTTLLSDMNTFSTVGTTTFSNDVVVGNHLQVGILNPARVSNELLTVSGDLDDYIAMTCANINIGVAASCDLVFNNALTTADTYYSDIGFNGPNYDVIEFGQLSQPNGAYWYNTDGPVTILTGTSSPTGFIQFVTGGYDSEAVRITSIGRVGIGSTSPNSRLVVTNTASDPVLWLESEANDTTPTVYTNTDRLGIATSTPWTTLSVNGIAGLNSLYATDALATSTFKGKLDTNRLTSATLRVTGLTSCDTIDTDPYGNFLCGSDSTGAGGAVTGNGIAGMMASWNSASNLIATSTIIGERVYATSTTATSTFLGSLAVGGATPDATFSVKGIGGKVVQFFTSASTKIMDIANDGIVTLLGAWNFGEATSLEIPNATSPTYGAAGILALDTTANNLTLATSTTGHVVAASATTTLYAYTATTSPLVSGVSLPLPTHFLAQTATAVICKVSSGTSFIINLSDGTNDTNAITCTTTEAQYPITGNGSFNAYENIKIQYGTKTGNTGDITVRVLGYRTSN